MFLGNARDTHCLSFARGSRFKKSDIRYYGITNGCSCQGGLFLKICNLTLRLY